MRNRSLSFCVLLIVFIAIVGAFVPDGHWSQEMLRGISGGILLAVWGTQRDLFAADNNVPFPWLLIGLFSAAGALTGAFHPGTGQGMVIAGVLLCAQRMWQNSQLTRKQRRKADPLGPITGQSRTSRP